MFKTGLPFASSIAAAFRALGVITLLAGPAAAQNCFTPVFSTPVLGCPSIVDYFVQDNRASAPTVAVADFNGDGKLDVLVSQNGSTSNELAVQLGNGDGTFQTPIYIYPGICCSPDLRGASWAVVGDFNGDGKPDIVAGVPSGYVTILLGNGNGTFTLSQTLAVTACCTGPSAGAVGDFNGDGKLDLLVLNGTISPGTAIVYLGNGDGTFQPNPATIAVGNSGNSPDSVVVGDFNGDGKLDFATVNFSAYNFGSSVSVVLGNGNGSFQAAVDYSTGNQVVNNGA